MALSLSLIRQYARVTGLEEIHFDDSIHLISFSNGSFSRLNIYYNTGTVCTTVDHPNAGKTQLFRCNVK
jgi:hypothetical protein